MLLIVDLIAGCIDDCFENLIFKKTCTVIGLRKCEAMVEVLRLIRMSPMIPI